MKTSNVNVMDLFEKGKVLQICAPMVRYSKLAFRSLVRKYNCDVCFTPMIVAADFLRSVKARDSEFTTNESDRPLVVQFAAHDAQTLTDAALAVAPFSDGVDLNCGCPQRWAMSAGYGACLINKPELVKDMVRHVQNQVDNPNFTTSIKIRIHKELRRTVDLCQKAESAGVSWITVHGRTADERHHPVHYDAIKIIKDSVSVPVIANGDIKYLRDVESIQQLTGVDGVFVEMTLQWTAVATFLYAEIGVLVILCLPFISPRRWQRIFHLRIWNSVARFWNRVFLTMIIILIVLFLDAVREVRKYSSPDISRDAKLQPNMYDHLHMKLFRAQRNLYISGFAVFLWLVMKRVITLINELGSVYVTTAALQVQADTANQTAEKYREDNELLKKTLMDGKGDKATAEGMELLRKEVEELKEELKTAGDALKNSESEADIMKKQMGGLAREYDRLLKEHQALQNLHDGGQKKDD
ncbi:B-cell receptor-associated protein 29-like isoform X2 [Thalassophryne amazonica]|uniref:B-cell receptor-associated protein 29-like isoform X2 n=1 Tax=Thalassophryne amazonica TaxID=390379 RepID=UPI0014717607|nr:B-cell receptor-associated protein 29-like isoform X2 [Thalassophryne amazonica]